MGTCLPLQFDSLKSAFNEAIASMSLPYKRNSEEYQETHRRQSHRMIVKSWLEKSAIACGRALFLPYIQYVFECVRQIWGCSAPRGRGLCARLRNVSQPRDFVTDSKMACSKDMHQRQRKHTSKEKRHVHKTSQRSTS